MQGARRAATLVLQDTFGSRKFFVQITDETLYRYIKFQQEHWPDVQQIQCSDSETKSLTFHRSRRDTRVKYTFTRLCSTTLDMCRVQCCQHTWFMNDSGGYKLSININHNNLMEPTLSLQIDNTVK